MKKNPQPQKARPMVVIAIFALCALVVGIGLWAERNAPKLVAIDRLQSVPAQASAPIPALVHKPEQGIKVEAHISAQFDNSK